MSIRKFLLALLPAAGLILTGCGQKPADQTGGSTDGGGDAASGDKPTVAFVTNCVASFWTIAKAGVIAGGKDFDANVEVKMPTGGIVDQQRMVEELLAKGVDGIAISPGVSAGMPPRPTPAPATPANCPLSIRRDAPPPRRPALVSGMRSWIVGTIVSAILSPPRIAPPVPPICFLLRMCCAAMDGIAGGAEGCRNESLLLLLSLRVRGARDLRARLTPSPRCRPARRGVHRRAGRALQR